MSSQQSLEAHILRAQKHQISGFLNIGILCGLQVLEMKILGDASQLIPT